MMSQRDTHYMTCMRVVVPVCADVIATPHTDIMMRHDKCLEETICSIKLNGIEFISN